MDILISSLIPSLLTLIGGYFILKRLKKEVKNIACDIIFEQKTEIKHDLEDWLNSDAGLKALYTIGSLIGSGALKGTGIQKGTGKLKWQDLALQVASGFIKDKLGGNLGGFIQPQTPQNIKAQKPPIGTEMDPFKV